MIDPRPVNLMLLYCARKSDVSDTRICTYFCHRIRAGTNLFPQIELIRYDTRDVISALLHVPLGEYMAGTY